MRVKSKDKISASEKEEAVLVEDIEASLVGVDLGTDLDILTNLLVRLEGTKE